MAPDVAVCPTCRTPQPTMTPLRSRPMMVLALVVLVIAAAVLVGLIVYGWPS